jgi:hypothetical protein
MGLIARSSVFHDEFARIFQPILYELVVAAGADPSAAAVIPAKAGYAIYLQRITFNVITDAAKVLIVRDDATTPLNAAVFPSSPGIGTRQVTYEPFGMAMTEGKSIDISATGGAGLAGTLIVEGYYFPVGPFTPATK